MKKRKSEYPAFCHHHVILASGNLLRPRHFAMWLFCHDEVISPRDNLPPPRHFGHVAFFHHCVISPGDILLFFQPRDILPSLHHIFQPRGGILLSTRHIFSQVVDFCHQCIIFFQGWALRSFPFGTLRSFPF